MKASIILGLAMAMAMPSAQAAFTFTNGDLILGFQATGGTGADKNLYFNLGSGTDLRDNGNQGLLGNISTSLAATYGANWYTRTDLYFGVVGNLNQQPTTGVGSRTAVDGDPSRTVYLSTATVAPAEGLLISAGTYSSSALGTAGGSIASLEGTFAALTQNADGAATVDQQDNPTEWANGWKNYNPISDAAFDTFTGGIQQNFGKGGSATYVDIQRVLATNTGASPTGVVGGGTYEFSIAIGSDGSITAIPEPTSGLMAIGAGAVLAFRRRRQNS